MPVLDTDDTSTEEESLATEAEHELEDDNTSFDDGFDDETEETEESDDEEAATESDDETEEESDDDGGTQSQDEEAGAEDTTATDNAETRRQHNDAMAKQRIAEREAREIAKAQQQQDYLQAAEDNHDLAVRQLQIDAYNNRVEGNHNKLENGIEKAYADIDLFRTGSPEAKEELINSLDDFERMHVRRDANGDPVAVTGDVYQYLQQKAESIRRLTSVGARQETRAKTKVKARTDTLPTRAPKQAKKDADLDGFDEEAGRW